MTDKEKRHYTISEITNRLNITQSRLSKKIIALNIEIKHLPGSNQDYIEVCDIMKIEASMQNPPVYPD